MIVDILTKGGKRDILVPYFNFTRLRSAEQDQELFHEIARLRYEVYCSECKYLDETDYTDGLEIDHMDNRSIQVAAHHGIDGEVAGTVRLVLAQDGQDFPFAEHCVTFPDFKFPPKRESAEVSRLIVRKKFRRRPGDSLEGASKEFQEKGSAESIAPHAKPSKGKRRGSSPLIMLGMYREIYRYSRENGIRYWYAAMEKGLARLLDHMGFRFTPVGPETDYYGPVTTYLADLRELEVSLGNHNKFALAWFQDERISDWLLITTLIKLKLGRAIKL